jgi:hypothetical protein
MTDESADPLAELNAEVVQELDEAVAYLIYPGTASEWRGGHMARLARFRGYLDRAVALGRQMERDHPPYGPERP